MQEIKTFKCDICGYTSYEKSNAEECENNHKSANKIVYAKYKTPGKAMPNYPTEITVLFEDNKEINYTLNYEQSERQNTHK